MSGEEKFSLPGAVPEDTEFVDVAGAGPGIMADVEQQAAAASKLSLQQSPLAAVEVSVDAVSTKPKSRREGEAAGRTSSAGELPAESPEKKELLSTSEEADGGSSIPAKYAVAGLAMDTEQQGTKMEILLKGNEDEEKMPRPKPASLFKLFRYATLFDWLLMALGSILAICHGVALPLLMLAFGDLTNAFINHDISQQLANNFSNGTIDCSLPFPSFSYNLTISEFVALTSNTSTEGGSFECSYIITPLSTIDDFASNCIQTQARCLTNSEFISVVNVQVFYFLGIAAAVFISAYFQISLFQTACERQVHKIRLFYYRAILRQEIGWFDANPGGELSSRLSDDIDKIHDGIGDKIALLIQWVATFFGGFIVGFVEDWRLTLLLLAFTPFLAMGGAIMAKLISSFASQEQKQYASAGAVAEEVLSSIRTVISFGGEMREVERYEGRLKEANRLGVKKGLSVGVSLGIVFFLIFVVDSASFWFGGFLISIEVTQGGSVLTVFFAVLIGAFALGQAGPNLENLFTAAGAAGTIYETIDRVPEIDASSDDGVIPDKFDSTIEFRDVCFSYPTRPDIQVMDNFTLKVEVGKTFALVGPSGCGKSTVVQLLQRFYDVASGEVLVGGKDVRSLNLQWLRGHIGVVSQEPVLFDTTIANNIRYGWEEATMNDIETAAKAANAHKFISELPSGYQTLVGERGTQLSGGQKQRIAIARALVRDPKILLLDEATSALDTESESIVQEALDKARKGRTTIVIAHRLSTIQTADVIASISDGQVVETGTHSELMDQEGLYYELVTAQSYGADENFAMMVSSPQRHLSRRKSGRRHYDSATEPEGDTDLAHQVSLDKQISVKSDRGFHGSVTDLKRMSSKKLQEEWDKEIPEVSLFRVIKLNAKEWWVILLGLLGAAINGSIWPLFALLFGEILEVFARPADEVLDAIHVWAGMFIVLGIVSGAGVFLKVICFSVSGENLTSRLRSLSFKAMLRQEMGWFDDERNSTGALTTRLANDAGQVQGATGTRLGTVIETVIGMVLAIVIAFAYTWVLSFVILGVVPIVLIAGALEVQALSGHTVKNKKALESAGKVAVDSIENIRTVSSLGVQESFYNLYKHNVSAPYKKSLLNTVVYGLTYAVSQSVIYLMYAIVFRFGAFQVSQTPGSIAHVNFEAIFVAFTALIFGAIGAGQAGAFAPNYAKAKLSANRIFFLLDRVPLIDGYSEDGDRSENVSGEVETHNLHFNYPARPNVKVLQGLNVHVMPGETLALVGPSGCGKSTVVSLLERFYHPLSGCITLDGNDIRDVNIRWLRQQIGIVSQEPVLFDASIADNVRYGALFREVSDEEVIEATKAANIHSFVESLPQGYNTNVGAKGAQLSGGQKQRIAIARALIRDPKVLLLDEATSALDTESEKIVQEALDKAREGRTCIVIAHRLSTIYNANCIIVISNGQAVEVGTHSELMNLKGIYYKLNRYQVVAGAESMSKSPEREETH